MLGTAKLCTMWPEVACSGDLLCCRLAAEQEGQELLCLAVSGHTVAAGAEGSILFWDRRKGAQAAVFDDTHLEAVTQVLICHASCTGQPALRGSWLLQCKRDVGVIGICMLLVKHRLSRLFLCMVTA